jgi:hypothetical protein
MTRILILLASLFLVGPLSAETILTNDGSKYVGDVLNGMPTGQGTLFLSSGSIDKGIFRNGFLVYGERKDGQLLSVGEFDPDNGDFIKGTVDHPLGRYVGTFISLGGPWLGVTYDPAGRVIETYSEGKVCGGCKLTSEHHRIVMEITGNSSKASSSEKKTGTGFAVSKNHVATAAHVIDGCSSVAILQGGRKSNTQIVAKDTANDLAVLRVGNNLPNVVRLRDRPRVRVGEAAINYGFPLMGTLSSSPKLTAGTINSLAGYNNNSAVLQFDAATQHGNSGGPVLDSSGNVIGVVRSKLDDSKTQSVNFATKSRMLEWFLESNSVPFQTADSTEKLELPDIAEKAETFTVLVGCWE